MSSGYVLDFSNRSLAQFVLDVTGLDIFSPKYEHASGSKANRIRAFFGKEDDHTVAQLLAALLEYSRERDGGTALFDECSRIVERLKQNGAVVDAEVLRGKGADRDLDCLARSVRESIKANEPEAGLDHLHTFVVKYIRSLCERQGIAVTRDKPLHSLFGEYLKSLKKRGLIESEMAERILKSTISILEAFNDVRNHRSLAHDNRLLGYHEALLILNHVTSAIRFVEAIEANAAHQHDLLDSEAR